MRKVFILLPILAGVLSAQQGLTITGTHPYIYFTPTRLAAAQSYYPGHIWTPNTITISNANSWAAHSLITNAPSECTFAVNTVLGFTVNLNLFNNTNSTTGGVTANNMRWYGETVAEVYDWCFPQFSAPQAQLLRDRWLGTTSGPSDPVHTPTDLASVAASSVVTSTQSPFLANMAGNNVIRFTGGGTHCPTDMFPIVTVTDANTVTVAGDPTSGGNASGCTGRIAGYVDAARFLSWGGTTMPFSNFFWGYWRNDIEWGVISSGESMYSADLLADGLATRWPIALTLFAGTGDFTGASQKGGVWTESSQYGGESYTYQGMPLLLCQRYGRDLSLETNWYREAGMFSVYNATIAPIYNYSSALTYYGIFSYADDQDFAGYPANGSSASTTGYDRSNSYIVPPPDFSQLLAINYTTSPVGQYIRQWNTGTGVVLSPWISAADPGGSSLPLTSLPLDYYTPGMGQLFTKNTWSSSGTQIRTNAAISLEHEHASSGDWMLQRNGVWLAKEWTAYSQVAVCGSLGAGGYSGSESTTPTPTCLSQYGYFHNVITLDSGISDGCQTSQVWGDATSHILTGWGSVTRLDSQPNYSYQVMDISTTYKANPATDGAHDCRDHNPYAGTIQREFLFIRPLETLVIFDRVLSDANYFAVNKHPVVTAANVVKRVLVHSFVTPTIASNTATWISRGQRLKGWFFGPATVDLNVIDEGNFTGFRTSPPNWYQQRLEFSNMTDVSGGVAVAQSYMVSVLRAGTDSGWQDFTTVTVVDNGSTFTLTLAHPTGGNATWVINKGATSSGGTFGYAASGTPTQMALSTTVRSPYVNDSGVQWPGVSGLFPMPGSLTSR